MQGIPALRAPSGLFAFLGASFGCGAACGLGAMTLGAGRRHGYAGPLPFRWVRVVIRLRANRRNPARALWAGARLGPASIAGSGRPRRCGGGILLLSRSWSNRAFVKLKCVPERGAGTGRQPFFFAFFQIFSHRFNIAFSFSMRCVLHDMGRKRREDV